MNAEEKLNLLKSKMLDMSSVVVAFSGGVDSTFLLKVAHDVLGSNCVAATSLSSTLPVDEVEEVKDFVAENNIKHFFLKYEELDDENFKKNPVNRCYYCKSMLFTEIKKLADQHNINVIVEGSNFSDMNDHRPGMIAAREMGVKSPLKECELSKDEIRFLSKSLGLKTWDKPEMACLSSRVPTGQIITVEKLSMIERAESFIKKFGVKQLRVRHHDKIASIDVFKEDFNVILENSEEINKKLKGLGFEIIVLDLAGYRRGSLNELNETQKIRL